MSDLADKSDRSGPDDLSSVRPDAVNAAESSKGDTGPGSGEVERTLRPCGVLVVESDPDLQWRLARTLTVEGNRVVGVGVQFNEQDKGMARDKIEQYLVGALSSERPTHTM